MCAITCEHHTLVHTNTWTHKHRHGTDIHTHAHPMVPSTSGRHSCTMLSPALPTHGSACPLSLHGCASTAQLSLNSDQGHHPGPGLRELHGALVFRPPSLCPAFAQGRVPQGQSASSFLASSWRQQLSSVLTCNRARVWATSRQSRWYPDLS
jgi:hypothetical protein